MRYIDSIISNGRGHTKPAKGSGLLFCGFNRYNVLLSKPVILNSNACSAIVKLHKVRQARVKAHVVRELVAEYSCRVKKFEDFLPLLEFRVQLENSARVQVVIFAPVRSGFEFLIQSVLDGLMVFFNAKCAG